ncbi:MAG: DUF952 domain-containing protein [Anaerolineae bacterium]|nr:DUF952 domain-containing protein [Anaerolineae bacterium]
MSHIYHITTVDQWRAAQDAGSYEGDTLASEGFIHCSTAAQIMGVANRYYHGQIGLAILCIETAQVRAEIRYEDLYGAGEAYPHIYGPLNLDAVTGIVALYPDQEGGFRLPEALAGQV